MPAFGDFNPRLFPLTPTDVSRRAAEVVRAENAAWQKWWEVGEPERRAVLEAIFDAMLTLLGDPSWVPMALHWREGGRVDVTFSVFMERRRPPNADDIERLRTLLTAMQKRYGNGSATE